MTVYDPATLGEIDAVDVVSLSAVTTGVYQYMQPGVAAREIRLTGEDAERLAGLWRALRPDEEARCHEPPYGLRFWREGKVVVEASLCWQCNNGRGHLGGEEIHFTFDARSLAAVALLMQLRHVLP